MTAHAPTIAFAGIDCLDIDVQVQISAGFVGFTNVGPITSWFRRLILYVFISMCTVCAIRSAGAETVLLTIQDVDIDGKEFVEAFHIKTWDVELLAVCKVPNGWIIGGGQSIDSSGELYGGAGGGVAALGKTHLRALEMLFLVSLPEDIQSKSKNTKFGGIIPATLQGEISVGQYGDEYNPQPRPLAWTNFKFEPARRCPDPKPQRNLLK